MSGFDILTIYLKVSFIWLARPVLQGQKTVLIQDQQHYFQRINDLNLKTPRVIGFGISNNETFVQATNYASGAIIGSAFVKFLKQNALDQIPEFIRNIQGASI